jgi:hypothetical protein
MNRFLALMELAWGQCREPIESIFKMFVGILAGVCTFGVFYLLNLLAFRDFAVSHGITIVEYEPSTGMLTGSGIALMSVFSALVNTFCTLLFLATILILIEYTITFCRIAYIYDNEGWDLVNVPVAAWNWFADEVTEFTSPSKEVAMAREANDAKLRNAILAVKNPEKGYTDATVPDVLPKDPQESL